MEEKRIYAIVAGTVQAVSATRLVVQPIGRQVAQVAHVVSKLRFEKGEELYSCRHTSKPCDWKGRGGFMGHACPKIPFEPITTIVLQARDFKELTHVYRLACLKKLNPVWFEDENESAYGPGRIYTATAFLATPEENLDVADYLPLWGSNV